MFSLYVNFSLNAHKTLTLDTQFQLKWRLSSFDIFCGFSYFYTEGE